MAGGRAAEPGIWDGMVDERDGEESGARVEMWMCEEGGGGRGRRCREIIVMR